MAATCSELRTETGKFGSLAREPHPSLSSSGHVAMMQRYEALRTRSGTCGRTIPGFVVGKRVQAPYAPKEISTAAYAFFAKEITT